MFEDQQQNSPGTVPGDLPTAGEPEDIFGGIDEPDTPTGAGAQPIPMAQGARQAPPSALGAGALRPKVSGTTTPAGQMPSAVPKPLPSSTPPTMPGGAVAGQPGAPMQEPYQIKSPSIAKGIVSVVIVIVVVGILGGGGWWIYSNFIRSETSYEGPATVTEEFTEEPFTIAQPETRLIEPEEAETDVEQESVLDRELQEESVLFGEPVDTDADGLEDSMEASYGTDPNNWDSDGDQLSDGDEVNVWETDPINPDTDGDSYNDGEEVKNGYNPNGTGKIFEAPQE